MRLNLSKIIFTVLLGLNEADHIHIHIHIFYYVIQLLLFTTAFQNFLVMMTTRLSRKDNLYEKYSYCNTLLTQPASAM